MKRTRNLQADALAAQKKNLPLLVIFSQQHCSYCELLDQEIIQPMLLSGDYRDKVLIRELMIDSPKNVIDFTGQPVSPRSLFNRYKMIVTPTVLLLDSQGKEIAERMTGINTVEYYGYYLDQSIDRALMRIRNHAGNAG